ncbi:MAG: 2-oxo acid dehydrogenase subunit E2 [Candidatus Krumholzibacteriia bacterium]
MAQAIKVPEVSEGVTEGTVISLAVAEGDAVEADQTLLELETDKAVVALPAPFAGRITAIKVSEGDVVQVGQVVMEGEPSGDGAGAPAVETGEAEAGPARTEPKESASAMAGANAEAAGERAAREAADQPVETQDVPAAKAPPPEEPPREDPGEQPPRKEPPPEEPPREEPPAEEPPRKEPGEQPPRKEPPPEEPDQRPATGDADLTTARQGDEVAPAAPSVRRLARELGVDIYQVPGSGPGGRIAEDDVRGFVKQAMEQLDGFQAQVAAGAAPPGGVGLSAARPLPDFTRWGEVERQPLSRIRELTGEAMSTTWATIPMVTQYDRADITAVEEFREQQNRRAPDDAKVTMTAILLKVCAAAMKAFPQVNSSLDPAARELVLKKYVHVGVAVDTPHGLLVPVVRDVDRKGIGHLARELNELAGRTRERKVKPEEMEGGTFTISNLGGIGGTAFTPLVYAPQAAILGVSRAEMMPVWDGQGFHPRLMLPLSLTYDHRIVDGADGARILRWICRALEQPLHLVLEG